MITSGRSRRVFGGRGWCHNYFGHNVGETLWYLAVILFYSSTLTAAFDSSIKNSSTCPSSFASSCRCFTNDSKISVDCSGLALTTWPYSGSNENRAPFLVELLNVSQNQLTQLRAADVSGLEELKTLDVSYNVRLNIETDAQWPWPSLETLYLQSCGLVSVPSLTGLRSLVALNIRGNSIGFVSTRNFRAVQRTLQVLDIGENALVSFPGDLFPLNSSLRILNLSQNQIAALQKQNFRNFSRLEALNLARNFIRRLPKDIFAPLTRLRELDLSHNRFRRLEGLSFKGLRELRTLNLERNRLLSMADGAFWDIPLVSRLTLSDNRLVSVDRGWIYGLEGLAVLNLSSNALIRLDAEAWLFCNRLQILDLSSNRLTTLRPRAFHHLRQMRHLNLRDNHLSLIYTNAFESLSELLTLDLSTNLLSDVLISGQQIFLPLRNLKTLKLASNEIRVLPSGVFDGLRQLSTLDLNSNPLVVFSVNALPVPGNLRLVALNTSSLLCDCQLTWLVSSATPVDEDEDVRDVEITKVVSGGKRSIVGTAECRHPHEWASKPLLQLPSNVSCGSLPRPLIVANPLSTTGLRGQNVSFECQARCQEDYIDCQMSIHWRKNGRLLYQEPDSGLTIESQLDESGSSRWRSRLTIEAVDDTDNGWYQCQFANELASIMSERAQLVVFVPPSLVKKPVDVAVRVGGTVRLECAATGNPAPTLSWKKDSGGDDFPAARERRMHLMTTDDVFFIVDVKLQDAGVYTCVAKSSAGEDSAQARLNVYNFDEDGVGGAATSVPEITVHAGATAVLECADAAPHNQARNDDGDEDVDENDNYLNEIRWSRNGQLLLSTARSYRTGGGKVWIIKEASTANQGLYTCRSTRADGVISERSWRLVVLAATEEAAKIGSAGISPPRVPPSSSSSDSDKRPKSDTATTQLPPSSATTQSFFDPTGMPGVIVLVVVACVVLTSLAWVLVIIWRRRRPSPPGGVATVVVSLHENATVSPPVPFDAQRPTLPFDSKHGLLASDTQPSVQLATVAF